MSGIINTTGSKSGVIGVTSHETNRRYPKKASISTSNLAGWYKDGGITDSSGNSRDGTVQGSGVSTVTGLSGPWQGLKTATRYPDSGGYISLPTTLIPGGTTSRTTTLWYKPEGSVDSGNYLFGFGYCSAGGTWDARLTDHCMSFMGCSADHDKDGAKIFKNGAEWVRLWYIYDTAGTSTLETYYTFDGTIHHNYSHDLSLDTTAGGGSGTASIGAHANSPGTVNSAFGLIRDFRMYHTRVLDVTEMSKMWDE